MQIPRWKCSGLSFLPLDSCLDGGLTFSLISTVVGKMSAQDNILEPLVEFLQDAKKLLQDAKRPDMTGKRWRGLRCRSIVEANVSDLHRVYEDARDHGVYVFCLRRHRLCCAATCTAHEAHPHWRVNKRVLRAKGAPTRLRFNNCTI
jgi:hypothetical protein